MNQDNYILYSFLQATRGNWRNTLFLKCGSDICPYGHTTSCEGFLLAIDADGSPLIMPVRYFRLLTGETVEEDECRGLLTRQAFEAVYALYLDWHTVSARDCLIKQLCMDIGMQVRKPEI